MPKWSVATVYGVAWRDQDFRKEYGLEIARRVSEKTEVFGEVRRDDKSNISAGVGVRVRF